MQSICVTYKVHGSIVLSTLIPYSGLFSWVEIFVKSSIRPPKLNFVARWAVTFEHVCDRCSASATGRAWDRLPRPWRYKFGGLVNARIASVLIRLLWLLPSVVNERGTRLLLACLRLLHFTVYFVKQLTLEGGPCRCGAWSTGRSSETEPCLSNSTSSL